VSVKEGEFVNTFLVRLWYILCILTSNLQAVRLLLFKHFNRGL
jgi:hypothetical protein